MIITEINNNKDNKDNTDSTKLLTSKSIYHEVIQILIRDNKIELLEGIKLIDSFDVMDRSGLIDEYSFLVCSLTNNPNLINNKWISDNPIGQIKNSCFPCKAKSKRS